MDIQAGLYGVNKKNNKNLEILKDLNLFEKSKGLFKKFIWRDEKKIDGCQSNGA